MDLELNNLQDWYVIKPKQPTNQSDQTIEFAPPLSIFACLFVGVHAFGNQDIDL